MHIDARTIEPGSLIEGDICIIGAGAAGISMALEWINSPHKVIFLEGGGFQYDPQVQELYAGKTTGQHYYPLKSALPLFRRYYRSLGWFLLPFDEIDFIKEIGWNIADGHQPKKILILLCKGAEKCRLGPYEYGLAYWQQKDPN